MPADEQNDNLKTNKSDNEAAQRGSAGLLTGLINFLSSAFGFVVAGAVGVSLLLFSCIMFFGYTVSPISKWMDARSWESVECTITRSDFEMRYTYKWERDPYTSDKYDFASDFVHLHDGENERFAEGSTVHCFVNPNNPEDAILSKDFSTSS